MGGQNQPFILTLPQLVSMDVKQEINPMHLYLSYLTLFFIAAVPESSEKLTVRVTLMQEVGMDIMV